MKKATTKKALIALTTALMTQGCTTTDVYLAGCDFVTGAYDAQVMTQRGQTRIGVNPDLDYDTDNNGFYLFSGVFQAVIGSTVRALDNEPSFAEDCG